MKLKIFSSILILMTLASCSLPVDAPPEPTALPSATPQPTATVAVGFSPIPLLTQAATPLPTSTSGAPATFCDDPRARELIVSLGKAVTNNDGALLASLVSRTTGMDVRFYRDGNVINYDVEHARFLFETTFQADWGLSYGSGESTLGSFHEIIVPSLKQVLESTPVLTCNQLQLGGATYTAVWPYADMNYYSVHFPGDETSGGLSWQTWAVGMDMSSAQPKLAALVHYVWEP